MRGLAKWCFRNRWAVVAIWLIILIGSSAIHAHKGSAYSDNFKLSGTDSLEALNLLQQNAPKSAGESDQVVVAVKSGRITAPSNMLQVSNMLVKLQKLPHVVSVTSPYVRSGQSGISKSGQVAYGSVNFDENSQQLPVSDVEKVISTAQSADTANLQVQLGGEAIEQAEESNSSSNSDIGIGVLVAAIVLFLVFGSLLATMLPLITAGVSLGTGIAIIGLLSHLISMASFSSELSLLIGLGVGVDYALFIVTRYRQAMLRGKTPEEATIQAIDTSGRAVLFAGMTVCIAMLGMFTLGLSFLNGVAIATTVVVAFTVIASLTLLPALISLFGSRILPRRQRRALKAGKLNKDDESPSWGRWARRLQRRPALFAGGAIIAMVIIGLPFAHIRLGSSDAGSDPKTSTSRQAYDLLAEGFGPGFNGPFQLVAKVNTPAQKQAFQNVVNQVAKTPGVVQASPVVFLGNTQDVALAEVTPAGSPQDKSTTDLLKALRKNVIPQASSGKVRVLVGGTTAIFEDFAQVLGSKLLLFIGVVVLVSMLLLMAVFRSLVIPLMAAFMNLLSVSAAFGIVVAVFQWGWLGNLVGIGQTGPIEAFLPVIVFAILFGLSMDYEVFLVSRIYEEWHRRKDNKQAVIHGLAATGRTITAAAAIMVLVFGSFLLGGERIIKLFGIGLASAVLLDALVVRSIIVPGLMFLIGDSNWKLPKWLDRLIPQLKVEGSVEDEH